MKKKLFALVAALAVVMGLAACASSTPASSESSSASSSDSAASASESSSSAASEASADLEDTVVIYSTHPEKLLEVAAADFEAATGTKVEFVNLKGELVDRVRGELGNPQADIMYGGDTSKYMQLAEEGAFEVATPSWASDLDDSFKAEDGTWFGTIQTPVMMFYNTEALTEEEAPKDWTDLTDAKYEGQIVSRDAKSSSQQSAVANWTQYFQKEGFNGLTGEEASNAFLTALNANTKSYYNSASMMFEAVGKGEAAIGISTFNDINDNIEKNGMPLKAVDAESGNVVVTDGIAVIKDAPHPNAAQAFLEFAGSAEEQAKLANEIGRIPTLEAAIKMSPEWMQTPFKTLPADWTDISANQTQWLEAWQNTMYDTDKIVEKAA